MKPIHVLSALLPLFLCACSDDADRRDAGSDIADRQNAIGFALSPAGRADSQAAMPRSFVLASEDEDTLYMRADECEAEIDASRGAVISRVGSFAVSCVRNDADGRFSNYYFTDQPYSETGGVWSNDHGAVYYWMNRAEETYDFYAYANGGEAVVADYTTQSPRLIYTVPKNAAGQRDILAARAQGYPGNWGKIVNLTYDHICTAVQFKMGADMTNRGVIEGIRIGGVAASGVYDMASGTWTPSEERTVVSLNQSVACDADKRYNDDSNSFLLVPQSLKDVVVTVLYRYSPSADIKEYTATLPADALWQPGKKVVYTITIAPELIIGIANLQDAHYTMVEVPFEVVGLNNRGSWTISSDQPWCTMRQERVGPEVSGYWIENTTTYSEFNRSRSISGSGNGKKSVWVFMEENATDAPRKATITLVAGSQSVSTTITQLNPSWTGAGGTGWERLEDTAVYPFGFNWDKVVVYHNSGFGTGILGVLLQWFGTYGDLVSFEIGWGSSTVTIDYSKANELSGTTNSADGRANTWTLYDSAGGAVDAFTETLVGYGYKVISETGSNEQTDDYAALIALKCNPFTVEKTTSGGTTAYKVAITEDKIKWFLPAPDQFVCGDAEYQMIGSYWTSRADNTPNAFAVMNLGGTIIPVAPSPTSRHRNDKFKVRALRVAR